MHNSDQTKMTNFTEHVDPNRPAHLNVDFVPLAEATNRYKALGRNATRILGENLQLRQEALIDPMTGLANEQAFHLTLDRALERENQKGYRPGEETSIGLLEIDIDNFKQVNDQLGHAVGDEVIRLVADTLRSSLRETDLPVHIGNPDDEEDENKPQAGRKHGDEDYVLIPNLEANTEIPMTKQERVNAVKNRTQGNVERAIYASAYGAQLKELGVGISIGAIVHRFGETKDQFIKRGDDAMYDDKDRRKTGR